jgi:hypothetical protein
MLAPELVIELGEHVRGGLDGSHIPQTDAEAVLSLLGNGRLWRHQPAEGRFTPCWLGRLGLEQRFVSVEVGAPQLSDASDRSIRAGRVAGVEKYRVLAPAVAQTEFSGAGAVASHRRGP